MKQHTQSGGSGCPVDPRAVKVRGSVFRRGLFAAGALLAALAVLLLPASPALAQAPNPALAKLIKAAEAEKQPHHAPGRQVRRHRVLGTRWKRP